MTMSTKRYKLTYFNGQGRAETIRLLFHAADVKFEDVRIEKQQWEDMRPSTPLGKLPVLQVDGVKIAQSAAIARYVAAAVGLAGSTPLESGLIDMWCEEINDLMLHIINFMFEKDEALKAKLKESVKTNHHTYLAKFERHLTGKKFLVGNKVSVADIKVVTTVTFPIVLDVMGSHALDKFPNVAGLVDRVCAIPGIKSYLKIRPETSF